MNICLLVLTCGGDACSLVPVASTRRGAGRGANILVQILIEREIFLEDIYKCTDCRSFSQSMVPPKTLPHVLKGNKASAGIRALRQTTNFPTSIYRRTGASIDATFQASPRVPSLSTEQLVRFYDTRALQAIASSQVDMSVDRAPSNKLLQNVQRARVSSSTKPEGPSFNSSASQTTRLTTGTRSSEYRKGQSRRRRSPTTKATGQSGIQGMWTEEAPAGDPVIHPRVPETHASTLLENRASDVDQWTRTGAQARQSTITAQTVGRAPDEQSSTAYGTVHQGQQINHNGPMHINYNIGLLNNFGHLDIKDFFTAVKLSTNGAWWFVIGACLVLLAFYKLNLLSGPAILAAHIYSTIFQNQGKHSWYERAVDMATSVRPSFNVVWLPFKFMPWMGIVQRLVGWALVN